MTEGQGLTSGSSGGRVPTQDSLHFCHSYKAKANSSLQTRIYLGLMEEATKKRKNLSKRSSKKRRNKKLRKVQNIETVKSSPEHMVPVELDTNNESALSMVRDEVLLGSRKEYTSNHSFESLSGNSMRFVSCSFIPDER
jgi:7-keto-8-aminopelargonate synthetase-like enzyme